MLLIKNYNQNKLIKMDNKNKSTETVDQFEETCTAFVEWLNKNDYTQDPHGNWYQSDCMDMSNKTYTLKQLFQKWYLENKKGGK